jgi:hypothetical protein
VCEPEDVGSSDTRSRSRVIRTGSYNALVCSLGQGQGPGHQPRQRPCPGVETQDHREQSITLPRADVLGFALEQSSSLCGQQSEKLDAFPSMPEDFLLRLTMRYPRGIVWLFGKDGSLSTTFDEESAGKPSDPSHAPSLQRHDCDDGTEEAPMLQKAFPRARKVLFVPLFEAEQSHATAGCFAFTTAVTRTPSVDSQLGFIKSFVNSVEAQVVRINAIAANKSKNAFIGSISHELRSPLHGILAAAEFIEDTDLDTYQKSLINTQVSCGKTLLQVIEHVLDYSKINSFEKVSFMRYCDLESISLTRN